MTAHAPTSPLTQSERRLAQHVVDGLNAREIAAATHLTANTVHSTLRNVRGKLHCPERCSLAVVAHRLLDAGEITTPTTDAPAPELSAEQISLLKAVTEHTRPLDIARAAKLAPADLRAALDQLLADTGSSDTTRLVVQAHSWNLLTAKQTSTVQSGAPQ
ncbi:MULTISPECIES: LuxR C-terminal-related transcriptional regulator [unclassified Streptomyces]|uniref:LuxR C-terminal-related transcriptional regulator n=1 Tax=unclassified Streptomyces TaxID=2593676 RepID=UPI00236719FF|nr:MULTISPECIES: LuxR C-terminal-related transcriptional regulator [unclassified Streptomyces]MDF3140975.1 LuxR C-terminal-related transcriptional regulator [Streptomyces sp. T21Q-yed]WDF43631.1 LuxR C-terminal-related transcriptional regulator [Streptomyces sp. T12]